MELRKVPNHRNIKCDCCLDILRQRAVMMFRFNEYDVICMCEDCYKEFKDLSKEEIK